MSERLYRSLYRIRRLEEEVARVYPTDRIKSPVHLSIGQEAVSVGVDPDLPFVIRRRRVAAIDRDARLGRGHRRDVIDRCLWQMQRQRRSGGDRKEP